MSSRNLLEVAIWKTERKTKTKKPLTLWISGFFLQLVANQGGQPAPGNSPAKSVA
jgi:hypothetical protein